MNTGRIDERDLGDLRAAQDTVRQAQAVYAFVSSRVAQRNGLKQGDTIDDDGTIHRAAPPNQPAEGT